MFCRAGLDRDDGDCGVPDGRCTGLGDAHGVGQQTREDDEQQQTLGPRQTQVPQDRPQQQGCDQHGGDLTAKRLGLDTQRIDHRYEPADQGQVGDIGAVDVPNGDVASAAQSRSDAGGHLGGRRAHGNHGQSHGKLADSETLRDPNGAVDEKIGPLPEQKQASRQEHYRPCHREPLMRCDLRRDHPAGEPVAAPSQTMRPHRRSGGQDSSIRPRLRPSRPPGRHCVRRSRTNC